MFLQSSSVLNYIIIHCLLSGVANTIDAIILSYSSLATYL